ncbi:MerR family transcriptional regulator [Kribbella sp. NPDC026611]|uniref:helix-turn-helix domain-containing protein n=1 Tax=Kribbella sp. NPDC026611 TaxID=3154911 RepID=UPI0033C650E5
MKSIGEVAAQFGVATHVLRHWETEGLLAPARVGDRRRYSDADVRRVAAILISKEAGFGLADIRTMLATGPAPDREEILTRHREMLRDRIARAQAALDLIEGGPCTHDELMMCPHFQNAVTDRLGPRHTRTADQRAIGQPCTAP